MGRFGNCDEFEIDFSDIKFNQPKNSNKRYSGGFHRLRNVNFPIFYSFETVIETESPKNRYKFEKLLQSQFFSSIT